MQTAQNYFAPGDIVFNHYGYDQSNIEFYKVTKVTAKFVTLEAIGSTVVKCHESGSTEVVPEPDHVLTGHWETDQNGRHGVRIRDDGTAFVNFHHGGGYKYDGKPKWVSYGR